MRTTKYKWPQLNLSLSKKRKPILKKKSNFLGRIYKDYDPIKFAQDLKACDLSHILEIESSDLAWNLLLKQIDDTLSVACPVKRIKFTQPENDWMTVELIAQIKYKDNLMILAHQTNLKEDWIKAKQEKN